VFDHIQAFYQPRTVAETIRLLNKGGGKTWLLAGGTDVALRANRKITALVDISQLGLSYIKSQKRALHIGATTTMADLEQSSLVQQLAGGILAQAAASCGSVQTRNMATVGGNLANASPSADTATPLLVMDAHVVLQGTRSKRMVPLADFFTAPHKTVANGSLMTEIVIPASKPNTRWCFLKFGRTNLDISLVNVAAGISLDKRGKCVSVKIALGAVAPVPLRCLKAESILLGQVVDEKLIQAAADAAAQEIDPISDVRASADYRREISRVLVRRALTDCIEHRERA